MDKKDKLVLIDGNSLINRAFYALPLLTNSDGEYSNAVYGFCNILIKLIETEQPKYMAVAFDMGYPTFRHEMYADYKAGRKKMPEELASQLPILKSVLSAMNIKFIEKKGIEADDIVGTLSKKFDIDTIIVSGDRDLFQLVSSSTSVWFTKKGISDATVVTPKNIEQIYGVKENQVVDLKSLMGDSSDNIKGVAGIGEKTAKMLISTYGSLDNIYKNIDDISGKVGEKLKSGKEDAKLSFTLATIKTDVELDYSLDDLTFDFPFKKEVFDIFTKYEFGSMIKRTELFDKDEVVVNTHNINTNFIKTENELDQLVNSIFETKQFSIFATTDQINIAVSRFEENTIKIKQNLIDDGIEIQVVANKLKDVLESQSIKKIVLNAKNDMHFWYSLKIYMRNISFDCNLALYLLSGSKKTDFDFAHLSQKFGYDESNIAVCLLDSKNILLEQLEQNEMSKLYFNVELPLSKVLFDMEQNGFKIDFEKLEELKKQYSQELQILINQIYQDAGCEFNINSPKQLGEILFDKLGLKISRNSKKSTGVDVLQKLLNTHPIIEKLLRYRKIEKLFSTYIEPFTKIADKNTGLIHTVFNQTLTATGRLSSSEPNLQNIPVRDEEGKNLRKVFIPSFKNGYIITSDYSQIELRLLAHYSGDAKLQNAYHSNIDIHTQTASDIFGVPIGMVTPDMRRKAKTVNFGIIYGISEYGLSQQLLTSRAEAKQIIDKYFETYASVKSFMNSSIEKAKQQGFVTTLLGRKRNIDELKSPNFLTRQFGERAAMNMPLQGTASDIIKIAMVSVANELEKQKLKSKLILQIHDELIIDCEPTELEIVTKILKDKMENAVKLSIPLTVNIKYGKNWFLAD